MSKLATHPSELHPQFLSNNSLDPWVDINTAPRKVMYAGHLPQALTINGSEERYWQTGTETRFGEYCFSIDAPEDIEILKVIDRFPKGRVINSSIKSPQTIVIYTEINSRRVGILDLRDHNIEHQYFGFRYRRTDAYKNIRPGAVFEKGTKFLVSPSIKEGNGYGYGVNLTFANLAHPAVAEDAIVISRSALKKMSFEIVESRVASWGQNRFAKNLFGDDKKVKLFKDVGEKIRPDGLLMAMGEFDDRLSVTSMGLWDTQMLDMTYDEKLYTRPGDGTVIDIMVYHDNRSLPNGMNEQVERYKTLTDSFYHDILNVYHDLQRRHNGQMKMTDEFSQLVTEALAMTDFDIGDVVQKLFHKAPIDDWRVEFKIQYTVVPDIGNKLTGCAGNKGIVCTVMDDEDMPVNDHGVRIDVLMSPESPFNRQNFGGLYEPYFNQVTREHLVVVREQMEIKPDETPDVKEVESMMKRDPASFDHIWKRLVRLYGILSPVMYDEYSSDTYDSDHQRAVHLSGILHYPCLHILSPTNNMTPWRLAVEACEEEFPPRITPVTYRDIAGNMVRTTLPVECGHMYFMVLEKISDDWIGVSTAKVQHLQVLGQVTSTDKHSSPAKNQGVKAISEAELRIILSYCGEEVATDLQDRNNSLTTHSEYVYSILSSKTPTNIERGVDRKRVPLGNHRALKLFKHILDTNGYKFVYNKYKDPDIGHRNHYVDKVKEVIIPLFTRAFKRTAKSLVDGKRVASEAVRRIFNMDG